MKVRLSDYGYGIYLCIFSLSPIALTFAFFPYPILTAFVLGISVLCLISLIFQARIRFPFGPFGYLFLLVFTGYEWYQSFNMIGFPEWKNYILWTSGIYLLFISTSIQFIGSFLVSFKLNAKGQLIGWNVLTGLVIFFGVCIIFFGMLLFLTSSPGYVVRNSVITGGGGLLFIMGIIGFIHPRRKYLKRTEGNQALNQ